MVSALSVSPANRGLKLVGEIGVTQNVVTLSVSPANRGLKLLAIEHIEEIVVL